MAWYHWSRIAASNATADPSINWSEGMAPSAVNDSARAEMAASAKYRDDISGAIMTAGNSLAYTLNTYSVFDSFAHLANQVIAFTPHVTNTGSPTINVDGLGAHGLVKGTPPLGLLVAGELIAGTPYVATYNANDGYFYLHNFFGNPFNIPLGGFLFTAAASAPNSCFAQPFGQAISRITYADLFALTSTTYGPGDGSSTFNLPDLRGRFPAVLDTLGGGGAAGRLTTAGGGVDGTQLGAVGGAQNHTLSAAELPVITPTVSSATLDLSAGTASTSSSVTGAAIAARLSASSSSTPTASYPVRNWNTGGGGSSDATHMSLGSNLGADAGTFNATISVPVSTSISGSGSVTVASSTDLSGHLTPSISMNSFGSGTAHSILPPTFVCNVLMRVL